MRNYSRSIFDEKKITGEKIGWMLGQLFALLAANIIILLIVHPSSETKSYLWLIIPLFVISLNLLGFYLKKLLRYKINLT